MYKYLKVKNKLKQYDNFVFNQKIKIKNKKNVKPNKS